MHYDIGGKVNAQSLNFSDGGLWLVIKRFVSASEYGRVQLIYFCLPVLLSPGNFYGAFSIIKREILYERLTRITMCRYRVKRMILVFDQNSIL